MSKYPDLTETNINKTYIYVITEPIASAYYVDDFMMKSDKKGDGTFIDDYNLPAAAGGISPTATGQTYFSADAVDVDTGITALYKKYEDKFKIGGTIANNLITQSGTRNIKIYEKLFKKHFNSATSDGYFKIEGILTNPDNVDVYDFKNTDKIAKFCMDNGIETIGHALIWDRQRMEDYLYEGGKAKYTRDTLLAFMRDYITKVMNHFNGKGDAAEYTVEGYTGGGVKTWDVLNEACAAPGLFDFGDYQVKSYPFQRIIGDDYGRYAFMYAHEADPEAELRYNDYGEQDASKAKAVVSYVKSLVDPEDLKTSYVDKIGVQSHYDIESDIATIKSSLDKYVATGHDLDITELDIKAYTSKQRDNKKAIYENGIPKSVEYKQAKLLGELFDKYSALSAHIDRVNFWTFTDLYAYANTEGFDHKEYAGIFDRKFAPKPQYYILVDTKEEFSARYPDYSKYVTQ
ncbi:MAG: endo-1,4-beta-xylanase [Clostridia bacterium]|nr:endo-1,4-beta-xylanase [Clostridia bacterium]